MTMPLDHEAWIVVIDDHGERRMFRCLSAASAETMAAIYRKQEWAMGWTVEVIAPTVALDSQNPSFAPR